MNTNNTQSNITAVKVIPYRHETPLFWIIAYCAVSLWIVFFIFTLGLIIPFLIIFAVLAIFTHSLLITWIKGNSVKVSPEQFPDLWQHYEYCCARLGITKKPEFYIAQADGMLNALATRFLRRDYVVLLSDVVDALEEKPEAIKFYMGHELGHIQQRHLTRHWWLWPGLIYPLIGPAYSRACEYTCDRYGYACCNNLDDAKRALAVLVAGSSRWKTLNINAFEQQAQESGGFWMSVNEFTSDYPWLCKRMAVLEDRSKVFPRRSVLAFMIAMLSPRMGYGGAVIGFIYWCFMGLLILILAGAMTFSAFKDNFSDSFKDMGAYFLPWNQSDNEYLDDESDDEVMDEECTENCQENATEPDNSLEPKEKSKPST